MGDSKLEFSEVAKDIFLVQSPSCYELGMTFVRFQEHYESPEFRGKRFPLKEYKEWYIEKFGTEEDKATGNFTYWEDWPAFNIPSYVLDPFYEGQFKRLTKWEVVFLEHFKDKKNPFYVIGTLKNADSETQDHEIAHGLFYTIPAYKKAVLRALGVVEPELRKCIDSYFRDTEMYHRAVWVDETHAYLLFEMKVLMKVLKDAGLDGKKLRPHHKRLLEIFEHFRPNSSKASSAAISESFQDPRVP